MLQLKLFEIEGLTGSISYPADTLANPSLSQENNKEKMTNDSYGRRCYDSSENYDRDGYSEKMFQDILKTVSTMYAGNWFEKVTKRGHSYYKLKPLGHATNESECSLWPTPTARDYRGAVKKETLISKGRSARNSLPDFLMYHFDTQPFPELYEILMGFPADWTKIE